MNRRPTPFAFVAAIFAIAVLAAPLPALAQKVADPRDAPYARADDLMPVDPTIIIGQLDNGLRYFIRENPWPERRAELRLVVNAGSVLEDEDQLGLAHFAEHMAFNGTETFEKMELVKALESFGMRFGADVNAYTSFDETVYMLRVPTDSEEIVGTAFQILEDWAHGVTFDPEEVDKERGVVIEEWRLGLGAGSRLRDQQFPILFQNSRYADRLPIGTLETLETFDHVSLRRFYDDWYRPDLMAVMAVGDFDKTEIEAYIQRHFADIPPAEEPRSRPVIDVPDHDETLVAIATDPEATGSSVTVYQKLPLRPQGTHGSYRQSLVEGLHNSMFNRRLAEVSQQPNPPFLGARADQGIFVPTREVYILGAAVPDGGVMTGLAALFRETERVSRHGFTATELEREKALLLRAFERIHTEKQTQDSTLFVEEFQRAFLEGESVPGIDYEWALYQRFIPEITLEEINHVAEEWLDERNRVVLVTAPAAAENLPEEGQLLALLDRVEDLPVSPYVDTTTDAPLLVDTPESGEIVQERVVEELGVTEWLLSNGVRVVLKPTDFRQDQILMRAISPGGTSLASDEDYIAALSASQVISASGFGSFSAREITNMLTGKVVNVNPTFGPYEEGFVGGASPRDVEPFFQLLYLKFTQPRAERGVFELITSQIRASLANRDVSPEIAFQEAVQRAMTQDHPRRRPISVELVDEMDLEASYDFYTDRFADASDFTFVFVGNMDIDVMRELTTQYLAALPSIGREESWRDEGIEPPAGIVRETVHKGVEPKSLTRVMFTGSYDIEGEERRALGAMTTVLQTRLREVMREDLGGTYSVQVDGSTQRIPEPRYSVSISFGSDPDRVEELTQVVFDEIRKLQQAAPNQQEVDNVRESLRRSHELSQKQNQYWLSRLVSRYRAGDEDDELTDFEETLEALTPDAIRAAAQAFVDETNYVQVSLLPEVANDE